MHDTSPQIATDRHPFSERASVHLQRGVTFIFVYTSRWPTRRLGLSHMQVQTHIMTPTYFSQVQCSSASFLSLLHSSSGVVRLLTGCLLAPLVFLFSGTFSKSLVVPFGSISNVFETSTVRCPLALPLYHESSKDLSHPSKLLVKSSLSSILARWPQNYSVRWSFSKEVFKLKASLKTNALISTVTVRLWLWRGTFLPVDWLFSSRRTMISVYFTLLFGTFLSLQVGGNSDVWLMKGWTRKLPNPIILSKNVKQRLWQRHLSGMLMTGIISSRGTSNRHNGICLNFV